MNNTKEIPLTRGLVAIIDAEDYEIVNQYKWCAVQAGRSKEVFRAATSIGTRKNRKWIKMHRLIMFAKKDQDVDHIDGNPLNNTRSNLRLATRHQNCMNKKKSPNRSSKYKGVWWDTWNRKWRARISFKGRDISLGSFKDERAAARAYDKAAKLLFGEFARLNFFEISGNQKVTAIPQHIRTQMA